jgi:hypothetical protein
MGFMKLLLKASFQVIMVFEGETITILLALSLQKFDAISGI